MLCVSVTDSNIVNWSGFRAIFLWLCSKDLTKLNFDSVQKGSPEEILMNLQQGLTTYAVVFEILCRYRHIVDYDSEAQLLLNSNCVLFVYHL